MIIVVTKRKLYRIGFFIVLWYILRIDNVCSHTCIFMENSVRFLDFFNKKIIGLFFAWMVLTPMGLIAQPFSDSNSSFRQGSVGFSVGESQADVNQSAVVYTPFSPFPPPQSWSSQGNNPVLYGPGGDPIGGLPLENGSIVLFCLAIAYALFRLVHTRFKHKQIRIWQGKYFFIFPEASYQQG